MPQIPEKLAAHFTCSIWAHGLDVAHAEAIEQRKSFFQSSEQPLTNHAAWEHISSRQKDDICYMIYMILCHVDV